MMKKHLLITLVLVLANIAMAQAQTERTPAFPGAEGFGRYVTGGRGGAVYHVNNLNDSGEGSLRWALEKNGRKTIVFDVSGTIHLQSELHINNNTTIAGQSAPGDGICIADFPCDIKGDNVIVRYMRFRLGNKSITPEKAASGAYDGWDGFGALDRKSIIIDHCSVSWSVDECLSMGGCSDITVQWCLVAQSMKQGHSKLSHGYGGNWGGSGASFHHNLLAHHNSRAPRLGPRYTTQLDERMDMRNNVIYNWGEGEGCYGGEAMKVNIVNNYYKPGPATKAKYSGKDKIKRIAAPGIRTTKYVEKYTDYKPTWHVWGKFFVDGNVNTESSLVASDNWTNGVYNQISNDDNDNTFTATTKDTIKLSEPIDFPITTTHTAAQAYEKVLLYAGACLHRDSFDEEMVNDTRNGSASHTGNGCLSGIINTQEDNKPAGASSDWSAWPTLNSSETPVDTDGDGMPDNWEDANGLDKNNANDGNQTNDEGYTNLELYLNSLVAAITTAQNEAGEQGGSTIVDDSSTVDYTISPTTHESDWNFGDVSITTEKGYSEGHVTSDFTGIKFSRNSDFIINLPNGMAAKSVEVKAYTNVDSGDLAYVSNLGSDVFSADLRTYPLRTDKTTATHIYTLSSPVTGTLKIRFAGNQVVAIIKVTAASATGINTIYTVEPKDDGHIYTLQGVRVDNPQKGIYIRNGKKIIIK